MTRLFAATDEDFAWLLNGQGPHPARGWDLPPGGVEAPEVLAWLRGLRASMGGGVWLIAAGAEIVGLCSYKHAPDADGAVEIGYGVAASRRGRGHATRALGLLLAEASADPRVRCVTARTSAVNIASQRVVERNGFVGAGEAWDHEDGLLLLWRRPV